MKYFKLFLTAFALVIAMSVNAQSKTTAKAKTATTAKAATVAPAKKATTAAKPATTTTKTATASKPAASTKTATASKPAAKKSSSSYSNDYDHGYHFMNELKIGSYNGTGGFGDNLVLEHEFHKYLAWDIISFDYSMPFNAHFISIGLKTGLRAFTPRFWNGKARGFTSLAMGYDCGIGVGKGYGFGYKGYSGGSGSDLGNFDFGDFDEDDFDEDDLSGYGGWADLISSYTGGYTGVDADDFDASDFGYGDLIKVRHGFALSWGIGVQFIDRIYVGYALEYSTVWKYTSHYARIGIRF